MRQPSPPRTAVTLGLALLLLAAFGGSAAAKPAPLPKTKLRQARGRIEALAMDGSRVAYDVAGSYGSKTRCNAVYVWNVARNPATRVSSRQTCGADNTSTGAGVRELALAGGRVAWIVNQGGNSESGDYLYVSSVSRPGERVIATAFRTGDVGSVLTGNWLGGLVGAGSFLAVDHWATDSSGAVTTARLRRIGTRLADLAEGDQTMLARSTDGRQVAVLRADGTVGLYSTRGALLRSVEPSSAAEVALRGDYLAVLTKTRTLEVFNSHSGRKLHSWRVAAGAARLDVAAGLAAYAVGSRVHVVRLATGKSVFGARAGAPVSAVQFELAGLAYAFGRGDRPGTIAFTPMRRLQPKPPHH
jgi:hypothetical protein